MKFIEIKYHNYRCFLDSSMEFSTTEKKNIALLVAPNGGGKTEIAFSFWWVLYGFDFKQLSGKKATPYALNSGLYKNLLQSMSDKEEKCWVELCFEYDNRRYHVKRTAKYTKKNQSIQLVESVRLYYTNENGETSLPIENSAEVDEILSSIIPSKILAGLIFDGERMNKISDEDKTSREAVEGVIKHITNESLFEYCRNQFGEVRKDNALMLKKYQKKANRDSDLESRIGILEDEIQSLGVAIASNKREYTEIEDRIREIHDELREHAESKKYEGQRQEYEKQIEKDKKQLDDAIEDFYDDLEKGYLLIADNLISDTKKSLETYDVPRGLTTEAVRSILKRECCICGHEIGEHEHKLLDSLLLTLPPDNIGSTLTEMASQIDQARTDAQTLIQRSYAQIDNLENEITELQKKKAQISALITKNASERIVELEKELASKTAKRDSLKTKLDGMNNDLKESSKEYGELLQDRDVKSSSSKEYEHYNKREKFLNKCIKALELIDNYNKTTSLEIINSKLNDAYSLLSEDYELGRRLYIAQYNDSKKYTLLSYIEPKIESRYEEKLKIGAVATWKKMGWTDAMIREQIILEEAVAGSTGQNKGNTLAFAKAILDYSREDRSDDLVAISKDYPCLIDSPFTELSERNQDMTGENIHMFANQIILLSDDVSYNRLKSRISPYVAIQYSIKKIDNEHTEIIKEV